RARRLAELLSESPGVKVDLETVQTNIVRVDTISMDPFTFTRKVLDAGAGVSVLDSSSVKFVTHHGISDQDVETVAEIVREVLTEG
ncbi:MAG: threonine aldolase, partial [Acidobacteriota bacterium]